MCECGKHRGNHWGQCEGVPPVSPPATFCHHQLHLCVCAAALHKPSQSTNATVSTLPKWGEMQSRQIVKSNSWRPADFTCYVYCFVFFFFSSAAAGCPEQEFKVLLLDVYTATWSPNSNFSGHIGQVNSQDTNQRCPSCPFPLNFPPILQRIWLKREMSKRFLHKNLLIHSHSPTSV